MKKKVEKSEREAGAAKVKADKLEKKNEELDKENKRLVEQLVTLEKESLEEESKLN